MDTDSFPAPIEKREDGLVLPPMSGIFSLSDSLQMTPITLSIAPLYTLPGDDPHKPMKQIIHTQDTESDEYETPTFSPLMLDDLIGCTFLTTPTEDSPWFLHLHYI